MNSSWQQFYARQLDALDAHITRLVTDSREVRRGDTFAAFPGAKYDGRQFIGQAIAQGANAVIWEEQNFAWDQTWKIPNLAMPDLRHKAGWLADIVYRAPSEKLWMVGVTGTNGKTSTSHWIVDAFNDAGRKCALIGTLGYGFAGQLQASINTTPDAIRVHGLLADYLHQGAQAVAMEVSSHALAQGRVGGVHFDVALLTNLSRDHLDYHGDMASYAAAKRRLFDWKTLKFVVLNLDDAFGVELAQQLQGKDVEIVAYGLSDAALQLAERYGLRMVHGNLLEMSSQGLRLEIHSSWGSGELCSSLIGRFNAANLLGALAVLLVSDVSLNAAVQSLSRVPQVAGRMQKVGIEGQPTVIVDYAHTPDALEKVLLALREACLDGQDSRRREGYTGGHPEASPPPARRLICMFGCGGDRDRGKREMMGRIAERFADFCIVTSDNPRSEEPLNIIADVRGGMTASNHEIIADRKAAIGRAIGLAQSGDTVLLAGKGHEDYQEIDGIKHPFSDVAVAMQALEQWSAPTPSGGNQ